ncbi:MAG TPA: SDR family oxidoreductase [Solirubrobacteraceae bacterium]|jgi:NAD(P)-dependent dehydrogenase (short-subunit alcohol dehydrogenase family)|nr:SDR family oxidoreductase [Solirubrobacteraceae bacterium]
MDYSIQYRKDAMTNKDLTASTALITGATSGIGAATARVLAERGARVLISGRDAERGQAVVDSIRVAGGKAAFLSADLRDADSARDLARRAIEAGDGHVDILVNSAAIFPFGPTAGTAEEVIDAVYALNVKVPFVLVGELAPAMAERGHGAIINITTMAAEFGIDGMALYGSSKAALGLLTRAWAAEYGSRGVRVNAVSPGPTRTEGTEPMGDMLDQIAGLAPAGRVAAPEEIAAAIAYLAGDDASFVHGAVLPVDGGRVAA